MKHILYLAGIAVCLFFVACEKFLDAKPDQSLTVPRHTDDLEAMLDHFNTMNRDFAIGLGEVASDDHFMSYANWASRPAHFRMEYIWDKEPVYTNYWTFPYRAILAANTVIDAIDKVEDPGNKRDDVLGRALFFRAFWLFDLVQIFSPPYKEGDRQDGKGIPVRLTSDINLVSSKASVSDVYDQIIADLRRASSLLNVQQHRYPSRPNKSAAFGALARCYLSMRDYVNAGAYADSALRLYDTLLDYNTIVPTRPYPFARFNEEVIFYSESNGYGSISESLSRVDTVLYTAYGDSDLRKALFFTVKPDGHYAFTGDYSQNAGTYSFNGLTTSELWLIRIEALARTDKHQDAIGLLYEFMKHRYKNGHVPIWEGMPTDLLKWILLERRKELMMRGVRWSDVRRFSFEDEHAVSIRRLLNGIEYRLSPEDLKNFAFYLPENAVSLGGLPQNN